MSAQRSLGDLNGNGVPDRLEKNHGLSDLNGNGIDDKYERRSGLGSGSNDLNRNGIPDNLENRGGLTDFNRNGIPDQYENRASTFVTQVVLPTQVIEKPAAIHEEIRREQIEEIQPIINVEKIKTEVHQVRQPLIDREVRAVGIQERMLPTEVLPQINQPNIGLPIASEVSTVNVLGMTNQVVEKPAIYMETQKTQIIEEIQPVLYREVVVPTLIKETKPIYQTIVEGTTYVQETLPVREMRGHVYTPPVVAPVFVAPVVVQAPRAVVEPVILVKEQPKILKETTTTTTTTTSNSPYAPF